MTKEGQNIDRKSLKVFTGKNVRWGELAKDCVCFSNAQGRSGTSLTMLNCFDANRRIGIEKANLRDLAPDSM
jgi:hypothetical protein